MKYKLIKPIPGIKEGTILEGAPTCGYTNFDSSCVSTEYANNNPDFFEPIVEKKTYDNLKRNNRCFEIDYDGNVYESYFIADNCRSETFLTRQEAEDEHARREWAVRKDRFIPKEGEWYWYWAHNQGSIVCTPNTCYSAEFLNINLGLAFRSKEEAEELLTDEVKRLFYTIR